MVEYYKTRNNYYYKKTKKTTKRIPKNEFDKVTKNGGFIKMNGGTGDCNKCSNKYDVFTHDDIENYDKNDINNFTFVEGTQCWCFKVYDLYKWVFTTDIPIKVNQINDKNQKGFNPFTDIPIPYNILKDLVIQYNKWAKYKGIDKYISHNGVSFSKADFNNILEEFKYHYNSRRNAFNRDNIDIFNGFVEETFDIKADFNSSNSNSSNSNSNTNSNVGQSSINMSKEKLKAIFSYMRLKKYYNI